jgi:hypothetical protein
MMSVRAHRPQASDAGKPGKRPERWTEKALESALRRGCRVRNDGGVSKSKKHLRECPALGREITSAECGTGRGSAYACPADCPFFPFTPANYDQHGEIESRLITKTYERAARLMSSAERDRVRWKIEGQQGDDVLASHSRFAWSYHWERDADGRTFGERWLADQAGGLSNDERVLLAGMNRVRPVVLEVQRILDEQMVEGVDLLDGRPLRILDRATAHAVCRYSVLLVWCYPMAHYERTSGGGLFVPAVQEVEPVAVVREIIRHLGGPADPAGEREWLARNFSRTCEALSAVQLARWQDTLQAIDACYAKTDYRVLQGARLESLLARHADVEPESIPDDEARQGFEKGYVWLDRPPAAESDQLALPLTAEPTIAMGETVLGRVLLGPQRVRIEAMSSARHQDLRARFERLATGGVEFLGERADDLGAQTRGRNAPAFDASLVPPRLLENPQRIHMASQRVQPADGGAEETLLTAFQRQYATFLDEPIPWLDGRTPRAAAADPALRPRLVSLMKTHICGVDQRRKKEGLDLDLNPLLNELGLHELISEPPPLGSAEDDEAEWDDEELDDALGGLESLAKLGEDLEPEPAIRPLTERDVDRRLAAMHRKYPQPDAATDATEAEFPGLFDLAWEVTQSTLDDREFPYLEVLMVRACQVLKPPTGRVSPLRYERIIRGLAVECAQVSALVLEKRQPQRAMERWLDDTPQPIVMQDLAGVLGTLTEQQRRKDRPRDEAALVILAFLKSLVAELSRATA